MADKDNFKPLTYKWINDSPIETQQKLPTLEELFNVKSTLIKETKTKLYGVDYMIYNNQFSKLNQEQRKILQWMIWNIDTTLDKDITKFWPITYTFLDKYIKKNYSVGKKPDLLTVLENKDMWVITSWQSEKKYTINNPLISKKSLKMEYKDLMKNPVINVKISENEFINYVAMVQAEAWWEPKKWKVAVAHVILNRLYSDKFPNSIGKILFAKTQSWNSEFSSVDDGRLNSIKGLWIQSEVVDVVKWILLWKIQDPTDWALFFQKSSIKKWWQINNLALKTKIWWHNFFA